MKEVVLGFHEVVLGSFPLIIARKYTLIIKNKYYF